VGLFALRFDARRQGLGVEIKGTFEPHVIHPTRGRGPVRREGQETPREPQDTVLPIGFAHCGGIHVPRPTGIYLRPGEGG
jgi:hypothetical protein